AVAPTVAVVTNVEADHLECYGSIAALEGAFAQFAGGARRVIAGGDDAGAQRVVARLGAKVWRVGVGADADVKIGAIAFAATGSRATVTLPGGRTVPLALRVPGMHNLRNAAAALAVVHELSADVDVAARALSEFTGVARRFERVGEAAGVTVMDDYAHHPTEVGATLAAARQAFPGRRLVAVFQPHLYSRTAMHGDALGRALAAADLVVVAPIYGARERPLPGVTSDLVARGATGAGAAQVAVRARAPRAPAAAARGRGGAAAAARGERVRRHRPAGRAGEGAARCAGSARRATAPHHAARGGTGSEAGRVRPRSRRAGARRCAGDAAAVRSDPK